MMFESFSIETLHFFWYLIISIFGSLMVFLMFVQGGQTLIFTIGKTEQEQQLLFSALDRKGGFTLAGLIIFAGTFFAAFPAFGLTSFMGAYRVWAIILGSFVIQAAACTFRSKTNKFPGHKIYEGALFINGFVGTALTGLVIATFFTGSAFSVIKSGPAGIPGDVTAIWEHPGHGLEAIMNWRNQALGLAFFFLTRVLGTLFFMTINGEEQMMIRSKRQLLINTIPFFLFFFVFVGSILTKPGFAIRPQDGFIYGAPFKYFYNLVEMPLVMMIFVAGVVFILLGVALPLVDYVKNGKTGIWYAGSGTMLTVFALFCLAGLNNTAYYPSIFDLQNSLTIHNSSASLNTLRVMSFIFVGIMSVIAYGWYRRRKKIFTK
jgi:cytochrome bd ubiquinol oxidase subunit II